MAYIDLGKFLRLSRRSGRTGLASYSLVSLTRPVHHARHFGSMPAAQAGSKMPPQPTTRSFTSTHEHIHDETPYTYTHVCCTYISGVSSAAGLDRTREPPPSGRTYICIPPFAAPRSLNSSTSHPFRIPALLPRQPDSR